MSGENIQYILKELGIPYTGNYGKNDSYVIELMDDKEWGKVYSILESNDDVEEQEDSTLLTVHNANLIYEYQEKWQFVLSADFDNDDSYRLTVKEI